MLAPTPSSLVGVLCLLIGCAFSADITPHQLCAQSVFQAYSYLSFAGNNTGSDYCQNPFKVVSQYSAAKVYCAPEDVEPGIKLWRGYCKDFGGAELLPMSEFASNLTDSSIRSMRTVDFHEVPRKTVKLSEPVLISDAYYHRAFMTVDAWRFTLWAHQAHVLAQYGFWVAILCAAITNQLLRLALHGRPTQVLSGLGKPRSSSIVRADSSTWDGHRFQANPAFQRFIGFTDRRARSFFSFCPPFETLTIWSYWIISIIFCSINYHVYGESMYFSATSQQIERYVSDRTGLLSYANLPILWLFAGRNNVLIWATGWKYPRFIRFHLHVAMIATLEAIVHSVLYTIIYAERGRSLQKFSETWLALGFAATITMTILIVSSYYEWLRRKSYEIFIDTHVVLSVFTIIGLFYHTGIFNGAFDMYLWPPVAIWCLDRSLRLAKIVLSNFGLKRGRLQCTKTIATYDRASDIVKLEIMPGSAIPRPRPGQYYFLYEPLALRGYENHPMTLGTWRYTTKDQKPTYRLSDLASEESAQDLDVSDQSSSEQPLLNPATSDLDDMFPTKHTDRTRLIFWIRPYDGWTCRLRDKCLKDHTGASNLKILLEGPYGHEVSLHAYDTVILIAGGSGISAAVPYVQEYSRRLMAIQRDTDGWAADAEEEAGGMHLVWAAREAAFIREVAGRELGAGMARNDFRTSFFCTSWTGSESAPCSPVEQFTRPNDDADAFGAGGHHGIEIESGRPDIGSIIFETARRVDAARPGRGKIAVLVCGPSGMIEGTRAATRIVLGQCSCSVDYFDESFTW